MPLPPYNIYRDQLTSLYHGLALWEPDPGNLYSSVSVGDVGYVKEGYFVRMFNVLLAWDDPLNRQLCVPEPYEPVDLGPFVNVRESRFYGRDYCSRFVASHENNVGVMAREPNDPAGDKSVSYRCRKLGAFLSVPHDGLRQDVVRTKAFEDYIRDHIDTWFNVAQRNRLDVQRMEDIILVSGCTLVTSWAVAAFLDNTLDAEISLGTQAVENGGANFQWRIAGEISAGVERKNSLQQSTGNPSQNQCVFIRGFRAKRILFYTALLKAAAEPLPDDPDNRREDEIQVTRVPEVPNYRDPLVGVLDYIAEKCPENTIAIAHDDDLEQFIEEVVCPDAVEGFLRQNEIGVLVENGAAILHDDDEIPVPEEAKVIFYAQAELEGELIPLILHPALSKYFLKLDMNNQPDYDYDLPKEEIDSAAMHPPMLSITLENHQGYPQLINVQASNDTPSIGVTVQDMLKAIHGDVRKPSRRREWTKLRAEERAGVDTAFRERCKTEEELGQGPCRIDYLCGRNRLQVFSKISPDGVVHPLPTAPPVEPLDESNAAGPSRIPIR
ncbi:hypothetical protein BJV78DRAFT_695952 [Lactifluus subvellereus]|nr:hypothetical protein BJV78DRAFT_695952 [Lactifluus subvellereus]